MIATILPLTVKGTREKQPVIVSAVNLAKHIRSRSQSIQALAGILTFSDKVIDKAYKERIKEEMQMTQIDQMLIDEGMEKATEKLIRTMLLKNKTVEDIHNDTDIPVEVIIRIKESGIKGWVMFRCQGVSGLPGIPRHAVKRVYQDQIPHSDCGQEGFFYISSTESLLQEISLCYFQKKHGCKYYIQTVCQ